MAAVFCASLSRRAMVARSRVIFTRSSRPASSTGDGARACTAAAVWATGVGAEAARSIAAIMSPLVTRPSFPEPGTVETSMPVSAAILRTEGASGACGFVPVCGRGASVVAGVVVAVLWPGPPGGGGVAFAGAAAPSLI